MALTKDVLAMASGFRRRVGLAAAAAALVLSISGAAAAEPVFSFDSAPGKLPKTVIPVHYAIELTPDLRTLALPGVETIDIEVREPTAQAHPQCGQHHLRISDRRRRGAARRRHAGCRGRNRDAGVSAAARHRPASPAHRLHGADQQVRHRAVQRRLSDRQGRQAHDFEQARAGRCAADLSVLG